MTKDKGAATAERREEGNVETNQVEATSGKPTLLTRENTTHEEALSMLNSLAAWMDHARTRTVIPMVRQPGRRSAEETTAAWTRGLFKGKAEERSQMLADITRVLREARARVRGRDQEMKRQTEIITHKTYLHEKRESNETPLRGGDEENGGEVHHGRSAPYASPLPCRTGGKTVDGGSR